MNLTWSFTPRLPFKTKLMWKYLILFLFLIAGPTQAWGQPDRSQDSQEERFERIKQAKEAFLREELQLTQSEAAAFFPVYWRYETQIHNARREHRSGRKHKDRPALTEAQALKELMTGRQQRQDLLDLHIEAETAYLEHLPAAKVILLESTEREFREKLLRRLRQDRSGGRN